MLLFFFFQSISNEKVAQLLIDAYPESVGITNNAAGTPLHLACCEEKASPDIVEAIIENQLQLDIPFSTFDNNGKTTKIYFVDKDSVSIDKISIFLFELNRKYTSPRCY